MCYRGFKKALAAAAANQRRARAAVCPWRPSHPTRAAYVRRQTPPLLGGAYELAGSGPRPPSLPPVLVWDLQQRRRWWRQGRVPGGGKAPPAPPPRCGSASAAPAAVRDVSADVRSA